MTAPHTYITSTIPYVNARPHIGFALELVQADVLARYRLPFLPDAAARITLQCTPGRDGRLPSPSPVFRRLSVATATVRP